LSHKNWGRYGYANLKKNRKVCSIQIYLPDYQSFSLSASFSLCLSVCLCVCKLPFQLPIFAKRNTMTERERQTDWKTDNWAIFFGSSWFCYYFSNINSHIFLSFYATTMIWTFWKWHSKQKIINRAIIIQILFINGKNGCVVATLKDFKAEMLTRKQKPLFFWTTQNKLILNFFLSKVPLSRFQKDFLGEFCSD
jgi:hypothetical protein